MAESYVRPPLVAAEVRSAAAARWRFRVIAALLLLVVAGLVVVAFVRFSGVATEDPGFTSGLRIPTTADGAGDGPTAAPAAWLSR